MFNRLEIPQPSLCKLQDLKLLRNNPLDFPKRLRKIKCFGFSNQIYLGFPSYCAIDISQEQMFFTIFIRKQYDAIHFIVSVLRRDSGYSAHSLSKYKVLLVSIEYIVNIDQNGHIGLKVIYEISNVTSIERAIVK